MKFSRYVLLAAVCGLSQPLFSAEYTESDILHATFAAFQEPGVFSGDYIAEKRQLLATAARQGNRLALLVVERTVENPIDQPRQASLSSECYR